jgi:hypothetical protein
MSLSQSASVGGCVKGSEDIDAHLVLLAFLVFLPPAEFHAVSMGSSRRTASCLNESANQPVRPDPKQ